MRCPECQGVLNGNASQLACEGCGRRYGGSDPGYLDLRPSTEFAEVTKYLDEALHADARHETVAPPLLSAAIRNDMLRTFLAVGPGDRVIDLGCGSGRVLVWNKDRGAHLVGIDVSPFFAREARADVDLLLGDLRRLPVARGSFTKAYSLDVLEHLSRNDLTDMLRETARVLVPDGRFFVYTHVRKTSRLAVGTRWINRLAHSLERIGMIDLSHERLRKSDHRNPLVDIDDLHHVAREAGFRVARIRYYTPLVGGVVENILMKVAERAMARRAARCLAAQPDAAGATRASDASAGRAARADAKRWIAQRGLVHTGLRALTWVMKLDLILFGRVTAGPFFALLVKEGGPERAPSRL